jgi:predicted DCC family thiol-disulfide oxidoreductase YuxK
VGARAQADGRSRIAAGGAPEQWLVLYDEDCGLCKSLLAGLLLWDRRARLQPLALQSEHAGRILADMPTAEHMESWHLVDPAGARYSAGAGLAPVLRLLPGGGPAAALAARFPRGAELSYRRVAANRVRLSRLIPAGVKRRASIRIASREARQLHAGTAAPRGHGSQGQAS